ncbi:MAG: histidinol-phosphate transaminase [Bacteroidales bacterium]|nr:histidinol-phosphate transaminase [Bacteroidales bacterium]
MKTEDIEALVRPNIRQLCPYSTARDEFQGKLGVFLDANESPYPTGWNRYPDPRQKELKARIAPIKGVEPENIFLGNGSDEAIDLVFRVFCNPGVDNVVAISPSYGMYEVAADINDIELRHVQLGEDFSLPVEELLAACDARTKAIFLCSPNNPSGNAIPNETVFGILERFNGIVVVDEAYIDFCSIPSLLPAIWRYPNLIVLQTFSKARGMAALRLGLAFAQPYTIKLMSMVKYPYNINESTQRLALEALERPIDKQVAEIVAQRIRLTHKFLKFTCIRRIFPSEANFLLVKVDDADALYAHLIADGIIVRNRTKVPGCKDCLRITVGLAEENDKLLKSLESYEEKSHLRR